MRELVDELLNGPRPSAEGAFLRVVEMDEEEALALFETLGTETTFLMYRKLQEEPKIPRELADVLDTSIQNVHYHLEKLERSNLVEPVETWRSEKGVEMNVYAPVHDPLVIHFGSESNRERLRTLLRRAFGAVGGVVLVERPFPLPRPTMRNSASTTGRCGPPSTTAITIRRKRSPSSRRRCVRSKSSNGDARSVRPVSRPPSARAGRGGRRGTRRVRGRR